MARLSLRRPRLASVSVEEVDEYLRGIEEPKRGTLEALRCTILKIVPDAEQVISYRVPAFRVRSDYFQSERISGSKHFGVWPLAEAAQAYFGSDEWPSGRPVPQVNIEFEVESANAVADAAAELRGRGFELLHDAREEPWGQTVARLLSSEGSIIGISYAPSLHTE